MDLNEVLRLCAKLTLDEDDGPVVRMNCEVFWRTSRLVRVRIDVTVPLSRGIRCLMEDLGKEVSILLREDKATQFRYGYWLRTSTHVIRNRNEYENKRPSSKVEGSNVSGEKKKQAPELSISSSSRERNYHGDEACEVEEEMAVYGVDSKKQLQATKILEYNSMFMLLWKDRWNVAIHCFSSGHIDASIVTEEKVH
ncbi:hypothetical protein PanWU01x14_290870 [Parasponia andersonii]|uniref:Uncharacterized protein n=1 Tax=Parasponia andersonii TaxID=3476 RepID=A0A2P5AXK8_PARAD|nr:hypothetical protein PanWU01x14_290870 [Parasponia andersonii]